MPADDIERDDLMEITLVFNGPLGMSAGKMAGQAFQACERIFEEMHAEGLEDVRVNVYEWKRQGTRTIVRVAKTPAIFERVCIEVHGEVMRDEGFTEVEAGTPTVFASYPYRHRDRPRILENKKVPLL